MARSISVLVAGYRFSFIVGLLCQHNIICDKNQVVIVPS
jgi:hypothetical protein